MIYSLTFFIEKEFNAMLREMRYNDDELWVVANENIFRFEIVFKGFSDLAHVDVNVAVNRLKDAIKNKLGIVDEPVFIDTKEEYHNPINHDLIDLRVIMKYEINKEILDGLLILAKIDGEPADMFDDYVQEM